MKKILVNVSFGGFGVKDEYLKMYDENLNAHKSDNIRTDKDLITLVESGVNIGDSIADIGIAQIPDTATDWDIIEYDGQEYVIYVCNGRLYTAYGRPIENY